MRPRNQFTITMSVLTGFNAGRKRFRVCDEELGKKLEFWINLGLRSHIQANHMLDFLRITRDQDLIKANHILNFHESSLYLK